MKANNLNFNELLEQLDLLSIPEHQSLLEISKKHLIEKKRKKILNNGKKSKKDYLKGKTTSATVEEFMKRVKEAKD